MKIIKIIGLLFLSTSLFACAMPVKKVPSPTGGSRSDGVIEMSYEDGPFEIPEVDWEQARATAAQRCKTWGYEDAEEFGGVIRTCQYSNQYGCTQHLITKSYQCTGKVLKD